MVNTIINSFDIWTDAQGLKSRGRVKNIDNISLEGINNLRKLILNLAIRGKLVLQNPDDESTDKLLKRIRKQKNQLTPNPKSFQDVIHDEKPFELPLNWRWARLGELGIGSTGKTPSTNNPKYFGGEIPFIGPGQITNDGKITNSDKTLTEEGGKMSTLANSNDILMVCIGGSIGKTAIASGRTAFNQQLNCISPILIKTDFLKSVFNSTYFQKAILEKASGSATPIINRGKWEEVPVPVAPISEQIRIVLKVEELMALCDQLEVQKTNNLKTHQHLVITLLETLTQAKDAEGIQNAWQQLLPHFDTLFCTEDSIEQLKQTIFQLAIMGGLVKQDPKDESARELLKKIKKEKEKLVKEGKIKKEKTLPEIPENEKPFGSPNGWEWSRLGQISEDIHYGYTASATHNNNDEIRLLRITDIQDDKVNWETVPGCKIDEKQIAKYLLMNGDILIARTGGTIGKSYLVENLKTKSVFASYLIRIKHSPLVNSGYLKIYLKSHLYWNQLYQSSMGTGQPNVNGNALKNLRIPLPPFEEQQRIVVKIDKLMVLCDQLKSRITDSQEIQNTLSKTIVENALS